MKKLTLALLITLITGTANARPSIRPPYVPTHNHYYVDTDTKDRANKAYAIATVAIFVSVVAIVASVKASEYNQGQIQIATF